jgi:hypothetical protein
MTAARNIIPVKVLNFDRDYILFSPNQQTPFLSHSTLIISLSSKDQENGTYSP